MVENRSEVSLLIAFLDLSRFMAQSQRSDDLDVAETLDAFYERASAAVRAGGGRVVKFMGDAALVVFPEAAVDRGVETLLALKNSVDELMVQRRWDCRLIVMAHFGTAIAGGYGEADDKRYDIIGKAVNITATLESTGVTLSAEAFRKLGPELRTRFKKHTPPISYIRVEDPHTTRGRVRV
jgi:adenylate cyclase